MCTLEKNLKKKKVAPLTTTELSQTLLPDAAKPDFDFETFCQVLPFWRLKFSSVAWQELSKDLAEVPELLYQRQATT
jgi:hypothetical protein